MGHLQDDVILLLRPESLIPFLCNLGLLLFEPCWDYQI